ncbi:AAA family ATPase [Sphingopyxis sp. USTB-05]|uniref:AAA family ATPase n=1 Tax=Sphingopyxis sp. USTB-05 TaxID=2830667 RepID=UPI002078B7B8|nr:AAA family ATPase [Sphingopyxis sp. USTB-05]USI75372.1 hypothetical protein KEC45_11325 [Sphingopyxis sp. USTB-05]
MSLLALRRLVVFSHGKAVYDEEFHLGVNIISGENGSGKSTIADFIFYVLGGEFDEWKEKAKLCDEVRAEISTPSGPLTLRRRIDGRQEPIIVFFGPMEDALASPIEGWERYPIRRQTEKQLGFSQMIFRACGIPEAPTGEGANVTVHQILRLLYADQRTPAPRLFRFERFDTRDIRAAVGDLLLGANTYELYEAQLEFRSANKTLADRQQRLRSLLEAIPAEYGSMNVRELAERMTALERESAALIQEIDALDDAEPAADDKEFEENRGAAFKEIRRERTRLRQIEELIERLELEISDLDTFVDYLEEAAAKANAASSLADALGTIDFAYCPACLAPIDVGEPAACVLCAKPVDPERESARYLEIKLDLSLQLRESRQILEAKETELQKSTQELKAIRQDLRKRSLEFQSAYELSASPREAKLAVLNNRIGQIGQQISYLGSVRELAEKVAALIAERDSAQSEVDRFTALINRLQHATSGRVLDAMRLVSGTAKALLMQDLKRQEEFENPGQVTIDFADDAILVDGKMNFAESSNVVLKNAALLALLGAAAQDEKFYHPRFVLMDNVEDKGMEQIRSHNFQEIIVNLSRSVATPHQIIFTTSMLNPELDLDQFTIGRHYTKEFRTLDFGALPTKDIDTAT